MLIEEIADAGLDSTRKRFELAVGMRLRFLIFAALRGTPFAALPYASKVSGLLEDLEMGTPPFGSIGIGQLIARIDRSWDARADIRAAIGRRGPALRASVCARRLMAAARQPPGVRLEQPGS